MSLFSGLKNLVKKVVKVGVKTAPIWSNFVPGGSIAGKVLGRVEPLLEKAKKVRNKLQMVMHPAGDMNAPPIAFVNGSRAASVAAASAAHHARKGIGGATRHGGHTGPAGIGHGPRRWQHATGRGFGRSRSGPRSTGRRSGGRWAHRKGQFKPGGGRYARNAA